MPPASTEAKAEVKLARLILHWGPGVQMERQLMCCAVFQLVDDAFSNPVPSPVRRSSPVVRRSLSVVSSFAVRRLHFYYGALVGKEPLT